MSTRVRILKDWKSYKKGEIVTLRSAEARQGIKEKALSVQTDIAPTNHQTKDSSDGNTQKLRPNNTRRR